MTDNPQLKKAVRKYFDMDKSEVQFGQNQDQVAKSFNSTPDTQKVTTETQSANDSVNASPDVLCGKEELVKRSFNADPDFEEGFNSQPDTDNSSKDNEQVEE